MYSEFAFASRMFEALNEITLFPFRTAGTYS